MFLVKNEWPFEENFKFYTACSKNEWLFWAQPSQRADGRRTNGRLSIVFKILYLTLKKQMAVWVQL